MKKRYLLTVMAAVMLAASLVGCARTSSGSGTSTNTSSETETAEADTATVQKMETRRSMLSLVKILQPQ